MCRETRNTSRCHLRTRRHYFFSRRDCLLTVADHSNGRVPPCLIEAGTVRGYILTMRPPRPEMSNTTPAPVNLPRETAAPVRIAARLGFFSVVIGLAAMVYRVVNQDGQLAYLRRTAGGVDGTVGQSDVETVALIAFWGTIGLLVIVFLVQAILIGPLKRGVGWTRWVLLALLVPNLAGVVLASAFLTDDSGLQLSIVEAMKLMNEIESEFDGTVKEILVKNEQLVEYGQPMFVIE